MVNEKLNAVRLYTVNQFSAADAIYNEMNCTDYYAAAISRMLISSHQISLTSHFRLEIPICYHW